MSDTPQSQSLLTLAELPTRKPYRFELIPSAEDCTRLAKELELLEIRKLSFRGELRAKGKSDWQLTATIGATVVQACVVTLAPVTTRIDAPVKRLFTRDWQDGIDGEEVEMPEDDTIEPLPQQIDLMAIAAESLALALPDYPRAEGAELEKVDFAAPGVSPLSDQDTKPFAGLADLKKKLENPDGKE